MKKSEYQPEKYNLDWQDYKGIPIKLILYREPHYNALKAKRFLLGRTCTQNIWIPNKCLLPDGTLDPKQNHDWIFRKAWYQNKLKYAGITINPLHWR